MKKYYVGLDLGQAQDYTALCILEKQPQCEGTLPPGRKSGYLHYPIPHHYAGVHLQRFPLGTHYPDIVSQVQEILNREQLQGNAALCVDATGCGRPVVDMFTRAGIECLPVTITGGQDAIHEGGTWRVPKRILVSTLQVLLQSQRLKFAEELPEAATLVKELLAFQVTLTEAANDTYGGRSGAHDDLVLAVAIAAWWGERDREFIQPRSRMLAGMHE